MLVGPIWWLNFREDAKRKASEPLDDLAAVKRIKNSHTVTPEADKKPIKVVPFPEKVRR